MKTTWILVANGSEARLLSQSDKELTLIDDFSHPESRQKGEALASDRSGHFQSNPTGTGPGAFTEVIDPKEFEIERFAHELITALEKGRTANQYQQLLLVAPPHFHGLLNRHLNDHLRQMVSHHVEKDYTKVAERDLLAQLEPHLG